VGYAFLGTVGGRGYATEAAGATLAHAREALGIPYVVAIVKPGNTASMRVLEKLGLRQDGVIPIPGHDNPSVYFIPAG
jgi:RimJ/RimL family protein N-acetyltransferase